MTDIEIVAHVVGRNMAPKDMPQDRQRLYRRRTNGWVYLTPAGREIYENHKLIH